MVPTMPAPESQPIIATSPARPTAAAAMNTRTPRNTMTTSAKAPRMPMVNSFMR